MTVYRNLLYTIVSTLLRPSTFLLSNIEQMLSECFMYKLLCKLIYVYKRKYKTRMYNRQLKVSNII